MSDSSSTKRRTNVDSKSHQNDIGHITQHHQQPTDLRGIVKKWPKHTFLIIGNEFCERFSFYGMRAVLTLYLVNILGFKNSSSVVLFHAFTVVTYTSPLIGSILADGYFGKFWTIFSISIVYAIGQIVLATSSIAPMESSIHPWLDLFGLLIIGVGTGGIKPCVSSFGGDQFPANWTRMISIFFSIFYFSINAGSLISMYITPYMRSIPCLGNESCYPLAFGIPALLMIIATAIFMAGSFWYKKVPPKENVIARVFKTILAAIRNKFASTSTKDRDHWLEYSLDGHQCASSNRCENLDGVCGERKFIEDVKVFVRVCVMMMPVPMFWALYDQQGSTWVIQAISMNAHVTDNWTVLPDQMGVINALLILVMIPIFQWIIYPGIETVFGFEMTMLRKMAGGGILTALSFIVCGIVQLFVNTSVATLPMPSQSFLFLINTFPTCQFDVKVNNQSVYFLPSALNSSTDPLTPLIIDQDQFDANISFSSAAPNCPNFVAQPLLSAGHAHRLTLTPVGWTLTETSLLKPSSGQGVFGISLDTLLKCDDIPDEVTWKKCNASRQEPYEGIIGLCRIDEATKPNAPCDPSTTGRFYQFSPNKMRKLGVNNYQTTMDFSQIGRSYKSIDVESGTWRFFFIDYTIPYTKHSRPTASQTRFHPVGVDDLIQPEMGGVYAMTLATRSAQESKILMNIKTIVSHNKINILWQIPQYVLLTAGEVMFSVTGLEFAYNEAAPELKSVVSAIWLLTTAIGDLIDVAILSLNLFTDVAIQMFVFGGLMLIVISIFILLAIFYYKYADYNSIQEDQTEILTNSGTEPGSSEKVL